MQGASLPCLIPRASLGNRGNIPSSFSKTMTCFSYKHPRNTAMNCNFHEISLFFPPVISEIQNSVQSQPIFVSFHLSIKPKNEYINKKTQTSPPESGTALLEEQHRCAMNETPGDTVRLGFSNVLKSHGHRLLSHLGDGCPIGSL